MVKYFNKITLFAVSCLISLLSTAQGNNVVKTADETAGLLYRNGKIYVVVAILLTILAGLILYLVNLDRKISRLEKNKE
jgi:predicted membrane protein